MRNIIKQWKFYITSIHYNIFIKYQMKNLVKIIKKNNKELKNLKKIEVEKIAEIKSIKKEDDNKVIWLQSKEMNKSKISEFFRNIFKFDGYIFYGNMANDFKLLKIKDLSKIYNLNNKKETYGLVNKIGTMHNKPIFLVKYPYTLSLSINEDDDKLYYYEPKEFFAYVNHATKLNILNIGNDVNFMDFIKKNIILIIIVIVAIIFLSTPQGQQFINDLIAQAKG